jgi:hypothetical protein
VARKAKLHNPARELSESLAMRLFGEADGVQSACTKFDGLVGKMRVRVEAERTRRKAAAAAKTCKIGPADAVEKAEELPVDIPDGDSFNSLLQTLHDARGPVARLTTAGALTPDGRLDLCKQVVRPRFGDLVDAIAATAPGVVSHFLVGNNIIFKRLADTGPAGTAADAADDADDTDADAEPLSPPSRVVEQHLKAFEHLAASAQPIRTFYLAGNGITAATSAPIAAALRHAHSLESLWLKMNQISTGAYHFGVLAAASRKLVLLDLFNTGLLDAGAAALADGLADGTANSLTLAPALKALYLSVNGLTPDALPSLLRITGALPKLESLFIGENRLGDHATATLLATMPRRPLQRLELGSNALTDAILPALTAFVHAHAATLRSLELSSYKSTHYFRLRPNAFGTTAHGADALVHLATATPLAYIGLDNTLPSRAAAVALLPKLAHSTCSINMRQRRTSADVADVADAPAPSRVLSAPVLAAAHPAVTPAAAALVAAGAAVAAAACARARAPVAATAAAAAFAVAAAAVAAASKLKLAAVGQEPSSAAHLAAVTYGAAKFSVMRHTAEELQKIRHPPQLEHVFSIYRNAMHVMCRDFGGYNVRICGRGWCEYKGGLGGGHGTFGVLCVGAGHARASLLSLVLFRVAFPTSSSGWAAAAAAGSLGVPLKQAGYNFGL